MQLNVVNIAGFTHPSKRPEGAVHNKNKKIKVNIFKNEM
jgi:hypothetical protein